jgi:hypothetical protein
MAVKTGMIKTFDVEENKVDVSPVLAMLQLPGTPLLNKLGISGESVAATTYEWWDDVLPVLKTQLDGAYTSGALSADVDDASGILTNCIIRIDDTVYRVSDVSTNTLTLVLVSGSDANHDNDSEVEIMGNSSVEGADYTDNDYTQKTKRSNVTQIFRDYIKMSGTQRVVQQYIQEDIFLDEVQRKLERMRINLERTLWNGIKVSPADNTTPRLMGGVRDFISDYGYTTSAAFTESNFKAFLRSIDNKGGTINEAWMHPTILDSFLGLNSDSLIIERGDQTVGRVVKSFISNYGTVALNVSNNIPTDEILVFDSAKTKVKPLTGRSAFYEELAKTGDSVKGQIIGEYTFEFRNPDVAGCLTITG